MCEVSLGLELRRSPPMSVPFGAWCFDYELNIVPLASEHETVAGHAMRLSWALPPRDARAE